MAALGERIREAREARGLTQQQVADALGVERTTVAGWEAGRRMPDVEKLRALSSLLAVPIEQLIDPDVTPVALTAEERLRRLGADLRALGVPEATARLIMQLVRDAEREVRRKKKMMDEED